MLSAKSILLNNTLGTSTKSPPKRGARNEFQAYAYKLAHDLNDLEHLKIYLVLAKKVERPLMEQAYSFVSDAQTQEKGKLFLWKLKKIRDEIDRERNKLNFSHDYVLKNQKEFKKVFASEIVLKQDSELSNKLLSELKKYLLNNKKLLVIGNTSRRIYKYVEEVTPKPTVLDISLDVNRINNSKKAKVIGKDFFKNAFKDNHFDNVLINNYWSQVPVESEITFIKEIVRVSKKNCMVLLLSKCSSKSKEEWKEFEYRKKIYLGYKKEYTKDSVIDQFLKFDFVIEKDHTDDDYNLTILVKTHEV